LSNSGIEAPEFEFELILRLTAIRSVCLGIGHTHTAGHLRFSSCGVPSLTRGRVYNLLVNVQLGLASAVALGYKSISHCINWDWVPFLSPLTTRRDYDGWKLLSIQASIHSNSSYLTTDGQSASLSSCRAPSWGSWPDINCFWTFADFSCGAPSLTRGQVCNWLVQLLLAFVSAVALSCTSRRTRGHIALSHFRLSSLPVASYDWQGYGGGIPTRLHTKSKSTSKLSYDRRSVEKCVLASGYHLIPAANFSYSSFGNCLDICVFFQYGAPSLTRGWVCNLWLLLGVTSAVTFFRWSSLGSWFFWNNFGAYQIEIGITFTCVYALRWRCVVVATEMSVPY
jgi:hypothetical protein